MGSRHHLYCGSDRERVNYRAASAPRMQHLPLIAAPHSPPAVYTIDSAGGNQSTCIHLVRKKKEKNNFDVHQTILFIDLSTDLHQWKLILKWLEFQKKSMQANTKGSSQVVKELANHLYCLLLARGAAPPPHSTPLPLPPPPPRG